jgi:lipopolysaccharide assembly protein A
MFVLYVLSGILGAAVVIFTLQNPDPVAVSFFQWRSVSLPLSVVIMLAVLLGIVVTSMSAFSKELQLRQRIARLRIQIGELRRQVAELSDIAHFPRSAPAARAEAAPPGRPHVPMTADRGHHI